MRETAQNEAQTGRPFNIGETSFNAVQGVTEQLVQATWYRGEHCNFNPTKADLLEPDAIERHELVRGHADDPNLFYFPAYEIVREAFGDPYVADNRHVQPAILQAVMRTFERAYCVA